MTPQVGLAVWIVLIRICIASIRLDCVNTCLLRPYVCIGSFTRTNMSHVHEPSICMYWLFHTHDLLCLSHAPTCHMSHTTIAAIAIAVCIVWEPKNDDKKERESARARARARAREGERERERETERERQRERERARERASERARARAGARAGARERREKRERERERRD